MGIKPMNNWAVAIIGDIDTKKFEEYSSEIAWMLDNLTYTTLEQFAWVKKIKILENKQMIFSVSKALIDTADFVVILGGFSKTPLTHALMNYARYMRTPVITTPEFHLNSPEVANTTQLIVERIKDYINRTE